MPRRKPRELPRNDAPNLVIVGTPQTGKTHAACTMARRFSRFVLVDPAGNAQLDGAYDTYDPEEVCAILRKREVFHVILRATELDEKALREGVDLISETMRRDPYHVDVLCIDEVGLVWPAREHPRAALKAARTFAHGRTSVWFLSQRMADIDARMRGVAHACLIFRQVERGDRALLRDMTAYTVDGVTLDEAARRLPDRHFIYYRRADGTWFYCQPLNR